MKRLRNICTVSLTSLSFILFLCMMGWWVRSYFVDDHIGEHRYRVQPFSDSVDYRYGLISGLGKLTWSRCTEVCPLVWNLPNSRIIWPVYKEEHGIFSGDFGFWYGERDETFVLGFGSNGYGYERLFNPVMYSVDQWDEDQYAVISVPHALFASLFSVLPAWYFISVRRRYNLSMAWTIVPYTLLLCCGWVGVKTNGLLTGLILVLLAGFAFAILFYRIVDRLVISRHIPGICHVCGYDLRATPHRCPECGTAVIARYAKATSR